VFSLRRADDVLPISSCVYPIEKFLRFERENRKKEREGEREREKWRSAERFLKRCPLLSLVSEKINIFRL
jgi:hypothetical protein